jgi:DNA polymerase-3 subunit alpha
MQFSHLHNHTQFSLLDGASSIGRLYKKAEKDNMPAVAITDHGNMFGVFEFVSQAWKNTKVVGKTAEGKEIKEPVVKPIVGCEVYLVANRHKRQFTREEGKDKRFHQLFLAKNEVGYQNLVKLCSLGYMEGLYGKYPRVDKELVLQYHEGLIATTCCIGASVPQAILRKTEAEAEAEFKWWLDVFGEDYYIELQRHEMAEQEKVNHVLLKFAQKYNVPIIASNDSHYVEQEDANAHDILLCINTGEKQSTPTNKEFTDDDEQRPKNTRFAFYNDQFYFKKTEEMTKLFHDLPQAIDNTQMIVDKVKPLKLERDILLPHFKVPAEFNDNQDAYLEHLTWTGAKERYKEMTPEIEERLNFELFTIRTMGFAGYFLIVSDFIKAGRDLGVFIGPGRGSAAGSVVAYCTGITNIDPIKYNLLFERFLNPDRKSMPDIDTDFDDTGRQKVIDYVVDKYGKNQVAHIVTYGTMAAKMSIKDVARVLDLPLPDANALAKLVPDKPGISLKRLLRAPIETDPKGDQKSLKEKEGLQEEDLINVRRLREILEEQSTQGNVIREAEKLEGSVRNTGIHAAGIIIAPKDLSELIPVSAVKDVNLLITQFEGNVIENAGVIKMDFLGLKTLTIIKDALALIKRNHGLSIIIDDIPLDDITTYELYQRGDTNGTFQFESPGMQKHLRDLKPDKFADLIAMNALYRPGPIAYIPNFIARKHGREAIVYDLPEMEEYLADTYGITVYQEQVMLLSQKIGGFSKGDADVLRKAMGKKQKSVLDKMKVQFMEGAQAKGHPADKLEKIWTDWEAFAQYAFNKSHSTCYAFVAYQTAYLKAHYPSEYMAAVMNNANSIEKITFFMEECQRMGIKVLGPDINESLKGFSVNKEGVVRFGLGAIKGVGEAAVEDLIKEREENGTFDSIFGMITRVNQRTVNKKSLESLINAGAFDCFKEHHRAQFFYAPTLDPITGIERVIRFGSQFQAAASQATNSLFGDAGMPDVKPPDLPTCEPWTLHELLEKEKETIGIYLSGHPLDGFKFEMAHYNIVPVNELENYQGRQVRIAGFVSNPYHGISKKGDKYGRMVLNDYSGNLELNFWRNDYVHYADFLQESQKLMITGIYDESKFRPGQMEFRISNVMLLTDVKSKFTKRLSLNVPLQKLSMDFVDFLSKNIKQYPGSCELNIYVNEPETEQAITLKSNNGRLLVNDDLIEYLQTEDLMYKVEIG